MVAHEGRSDQEPPSKGRSETNPRDKTRLTSCIQPIAPPRETVGVRPIPPYKTKTPTITTAKVPYTSTVPINPQIRPAIANP